MNLITAHKVGFSLCSIRNLLYNDLHQSLMVHKQSFFCISSCNPKEVNYKNTPGMLNYSTSSLVSRKSTSDFGWSYLFRICEEKFLKGSHSSQWLSNLTRNLTYHRVNMPKPETTHKNLRFKVHYPEDGEYTIKKLDMTKLGGRDPETGRIIFGKIGGGHKRKYRWVMFNRLPAGFKDPLIEKVFHIQYDPNRTARIALVGHEDFLRFIIATDSMKPGDIITSTRELPRIPIRPKLGDAHPVGALPAGTEICCFEKLPNSGLCKKLAGGTSGVILRRVKGKVIVQLSSLHECALDPNCLACVGKVSNHNHSKLVIGSAQRNRWLGVRPSSGLWQRKTGRFGFKRKHKGEPVHFEQLKPETPVLNLTITGEGPSRKIIPCTDRVT